MRDIRVSVEVFAKIWALRENGESDEDQILTRVLGVKATGSSESPISAAKEQGAGPTFPEGFRIYRNYSGALYQAVRKGSGWYFSHDQKIYSSINQMSRAIGIKNENVWTNWEFKDESGGFKKIEALRSPDHVRRRKAATATNLRLEDLGL